MGTVCSGLDQSYDQIACCNLSPDYQVLPNNLSLEILKSQSLSKVFPTQDYMPSKAVTALCISMGFRALSQ